MADIAALEGTDLDGAVLRVGDLTAGRYAEQAHFKIFLEHDGRRSDRPIMHGLASAGRTHIPGWIDGFYGGRAVFDDEPVSLADRGWQRPLFLAIGETLVPGGWLGLAYETLGVDTPLLARTRRWLDRGVPPVLTPLGQLLRIAGCGLHIRNWYISEGWREGPRKLQGFRPVHDESRQKHTRETVEALERFLEDSEDPETEGLRERAREMLEELG